MQFNSILMMLVEILSAIFQKLPTNVLITPSYSKIVEFIGMYAH